MARWEEGARERLVLAALDLFTEQGYDATTVAQIVERAGVTKSTFFRHFPDKRELLVAGQEALSTLLAQGIATAAEDATPLEAVAAGLASAATMMGPGVRERGLRMRAAIAASAELQERDALKSVGLSVAMSDALVARGFPDVVARLAAELGVLAFKRGFAAWLEADGTDTPGTPHTQGDAGAAADSPADGGLAPYALAALEELKAASVALC